MNAGWYAVYVLMVFLNQVICFINGYPIYVWQNWVYSAMLIMCFVAGAEWRRGD